MLYPISFEGIFILVERPGISNGNRSRFDLAVDEAPCHLSYARAVLLENVIEVLLTILGQFTERLAQRSLLRGRTTPLCGTLSN